MSESMPQKPVAAQTSPTVDAGHQPADQPTMARSHLIALCAALHGASFLFPWIITIFGRLSGVEFAKAGGAGTLLWIWPVLSGVTVWQAATGKPYKFAGQMAGVTPFVVLAYAYAKTENLQFVDNIAGGGWFALVCGAMLLVFSRR